MQTNVYTEKYSVLKKLRSTLLRENSLFNSKQNFFLLQSKKDYLIEFH